MRTPALGVLVAAALALSLLAMTHAAEAQSASGVRRVGLFYSTSPISELAGPEPSHPAAREFIKELRARGWVEGQNLILERRSAEGQPDRYEPILQELVGLKCDVIVIVNTPMAYIARKVTRTVPIVLGGVGDPVLSGLVTNLARPGGNMTGLSATDPDIDRKRLEMLNKPSQKHAAWRFSMGLRPRMPLPTARPERPPRRRSGSS